MCYTWTSLYFTLKRLLSYSRPYRRSLMMAAMILWLVAATEVAGPIVISYFIDYILPENILSLWRVTELIVIYLALQVLSAMLRYYQALLFNRTALNIVQQMRTEVMDAALRQPLNVFDTQPIGQLISRVTNDTEVVKDLYVTVVASMIRSITLISAMLVAMFLLNWRLACVSLVLFPFITVVMWLYQHYSTPIVRRMRAYVADINNGFNEAINGMGVIQQFRQQLRFGVKLQRASYAHFQTRMETLRLEGYLLRPLLSLLFALILCSMLLLFGLNLGGTIGVGVLYAFINYLGRLNEPLIELTSQQSIMQQAAVAGERIFELIDSPAQKYGMDDLPLSGGAIELRNLYFAYRHGSPVLRHISLTAPERSFIALVGQTGSGKSTLANLIMGYYPVSEGTLLLDGRPIETLSHRVLRQGVAMVQQDPVVMADTIYGNVTLGRNINEHQVWRALEEVQLASLVRSLPAGIFTQLGEQGNTLSIGQKQLLALARVLVSAPAILLLDEATANIDSGTEQAIARALQTVRQNTTLVVIAHRLSTVIEADQILVLNQGEAVERGTHATLLQARGRYYQMYQLQQAGKALYTDVPQALSG
ncbi:SmdB family multidrug efflux ABC transporter permease/ATP-binding protein [Sodalis endosymbiont of Henestaris halophilus]|uniref:SmdB family multidrug efflux ABC transporter permease/ATP-binding protein n=1 Tax=Sodalis endosymbiont of Henestaris halophilus TaxID=1929246 RepID=UPI000BC072BE|nr:SmdB family multidrug efflux ABC transporter permease/ATP-binding protein [Sodalis endosymbiont of Henestaris halophilus]SNC58490.1 Multidrug resistance-like ATP-binding protein MdlB [Sodalis endosymbiont of Henestaris halophilus]